MSSHCTGVPVSWLRLEEYRLGGLPEDQRREVAAHLASCAACAACEARIEADEGVALPPLVHRASRTRARRVFTVAGPLAAAAALLLAIGHAWRAPVEETPGTSRAKGGSVAFTLVRDDGERVSEASGVFRDGDRFKAIVTCPPSMSARFDLVVIDAEGTSFPLEAGGPLGCGNEVPLPGAFRLTGAAGERVCLVWSEDGPVDRGALLRTGTPAEGRSLCKDLAPGP